MKAEKNIIETYIGTADDKTYYLTKIKRDHITTFTISFESALPNSKPFVFHRSESRKYITRIWNKIKNAGRSYSFLSQYDAAAARAEARAAAVAKKV